MKVSQKGTAPKLTGLYTCTGCRSQIEIERSTEVKSWAGNRYEGLTIIADCPVCKREKPMLSEKKAKR